MTKISKLLKLALITATIAGCSGESTHGPDRFYTLGENQFGSAQAMANYYNGGVKEDAS